MNYGMIIFPSRFTTNYVYNDFPVNTYAKPLRLLSSLPSYRMWHIRVFAEHIWVLERVSYAVNKTLAIRNIRLEQQKKFMSEINSSPNDG